MRKAIGYGTGFVIFAALSVWLSGFIPHGIEPGMKTQAQQIGLHLASATCPSAVTVTTTGPTVVASSGGISTAPGQTVRVLAVANVTMASGTSGFTMSLRRGASATGVALVTPTTISPTANATQSLAIGGEDTPGEVTGQQYNLTVSPTGAAGAGSVVSCELSVAGY